MDDLTIVIQAGGESRRMGRDKALVPFMGKTLIEYILNQTNALGLETIIIANQPDDYKFLNLPVFTDVLKGKGALGGILTALRVVNSRKCLLLACDMPFVNLQIAEYMYSFSGFYDLVIPVNHSERYEPFKAIYSKSCKIAIEKAIQSNELKISSFFNLVNFKAIRIKEIQRIDPELISFTNINTPDELYQAEQLAVKLDTISKN